MYYRNLGNFFHNIVWYALYFLLQFRIDRPSFNRTPTAPYLVITWCVFDISCLLHDWQVVSIAQITWSLMLVNSQRSKHICISLSPAIYFQVIWYNNCHVLHIYRMTWDLMRSGNLRKFSQRHNACQDIIMMAPAFHNPSHQRLKYWCCFQTFVLHHPVR